MNKPKPPVVVDSSALVAMLKLDDMDNTLATEIMDGIIAPQGLTALLPFEVLAESLNIIGKKLGKRAAVKSGQALVERESVGDIRFVSTNSKTIKLALDLQTVAKGDPSFIDCLVMAHADQHQSEYVFGFDATFRKNGYKLPSK